MKVELKIDLTKEESKLAIPLFSKGKIPYIREERNNYFTIQLPTGRYPRYQVINRTTYEILQLMDGEKTLEKIIEVLVSKYGENHRAQITNDLEKLIPSLIVTNLITFRKDTWPAMDNLLIVNDKTGNKVKFAFENGVKEVERFLSQKDKIIGFKYANPTSYDVAADLVQFRVSMFELGQLFFLMYDASDNVIGVAAFNTSDLSKYITNSVCNLNFMFCPTKNVGEFLCESVSLVQKIALSKINKVRAFLPEDKKEEYKELVTVGFKEVALLPKEKDNENLYLMDYLIE